MKKCSVDFSGLFNFKIGYKKYKINFGDYCTVIYLGFFRLFNRFSCMHSGVHREYQHAFYDHGRVT